MKRLIPALAFAGLLAGSAQAQIPGYIPLGCGQLASFSGLTSLNTIVVGGVTGIPTGAKLVNIFVETNNIRYADGGSTPTASVGVELLANQWFSYSGNLNQLAFFPTTGSATVDACFYD